MKRYDLLVTGGGFTGVAAAIAAAREGLSVLLVEAGGSLGGAAANCLVNPFMSYATTVDGEKLLLSRGLFATFVERLSEMGAIDRGGVFHEEYLKLLLDRMTREAGVEVLFHALLTGVKREGGRILSLTFSGKSGSFELEADEYIDATGDADLSYLAGCPFRLGRDADSLCQPMTLCFRLANVDKEKYRLHKSEINPLYKRLQAEGKIKNIREDVLIFDNLVPGVLHFNSTRIVKLNPTDPFDLSRAEMDAREQMFELYFFLKENIPGFEESEISFSAPSIGVRESRMIDGLHVLTAEDLKACTRFPDAIAAGNYDIDIHNPEGSGTSHYYFPAGQYYTIPFRSLIPRGTENLLVAGRCISATHEAQASIRIMPICATTGEAAVVGAA
ncbi:MAG: FAD-dependent oxidoreductase, partial [Clostridia bacterium]|nr:FAD-dependent oxidoreductase [Clostridia bacterium]